VIAASGESKSRKRPPPSQDVVAKQAEEEHTKPWTRAISSLEIDGTELEDELKEMLAVLAGEKHSEADST
jgi:hypothetical protein